jgi:nitrate reductase alpha subunit
VFGFSPIPAMSMVSYAAGTRYLSLLGGTCMSFYDWYCDLPPASPQTWGEQTDVPESADWYNAGFLILWGSNVPQTRTPDALRTGLRHYILTVKTERPGRAIRQFCAWLVAQTDADGA